MSAETIPTPAQPLAAWLDAIAAPTAAPAGGSAAAVAGALAAALGGMVAALTMDRPRYADSHAEAAMARARAADLLRAMLALAVRDAEAFAGFTRALALPNGTESERAARTRAKAVALTEGARVQLELLERIADAADLALAMAERGLKSALGDAATAVFLATGAARGAYWAVRSNLIDRRGDEEAETMIVEGRRRLERAEAAERAVRRRLDEAVG
jgi:formiminotetrahydrofolate cyclodeaminase